MHREKSCSCGPVAVIRMVILHQRTATGHKQAYSTLQSTLYTLYIGTYQKEYIMLRCPYWIYNSIRQIECYIENCCDKSDWLNCKNRVEILHINMLALMLTSAFRNSLFIATHVCLLPAGAATISYNHAQPDTFLHLFW